MRKGGSENGIVRIAKGTDDGEVNHVGMGILLDSRRILTCAHVINAALNRPELTNTRPESGKIHVSFPIAYDEQLQPAAIIDWSSPGRDGLDCALLELETAAPASVGVALISVMDADDVFDDTLTIFGSLGTGHPGAHVTARLLGDVGAQLSQLQVDGQYGVERGFSGGAVWDRQQRATIGMIVARQHGRGGSVGYFLSARRIAERFGHLLPIEVRRVSVRRQASFTVAALLLFLLMLLHYMASQGSATTFLAPWADGSKLLAAYFGAHVFAVILGPYVMWHAFQHARSFALQKWWQRVPAIFPVKGRIGVLENTRVGAILTVLFLFLLPVLAQGRFMDETFFDSAQVYVHATRFKEDMGIEEFTCNIEEKNWCTHDDVGLWTFIPQFPYFNHIYQIGAACGPADPCPIVTYFPGLQPTILFAGTIMAYLCFLLFVYALIRPWPFHIISNQPNKETG